MTDETAGLLAPECASTVRAPLRRFGLGAMTLGHKTVAAATLLAAIGVAIYIYRYEGWPMNQLYVACATGLMGALVTLATRRILTAAVLVPALVAIVVAAGAEKFRLVEMNVHAYDIVFYLTEPATLTFLWSEYRLALATLLGALGALAASVVIAYRLDSTRIPRRYSAAAALLLALGTAAGAQLKGERPHTQQYWDDVTLSTFYSSLADTAETLWRGQLIEASAHTNSDAPLFTIPSRCETPEKPPHILLIHQESVVPPSVVPGVAYDTGLDPFFRSWDGRLHKMRVETYGGASWLTEFSILTGVSTFSFGSMRAFVHSLMSGKVKDTLPQTLARCGYRNVAFFPGDSNFVSYAKFYKAAGIGEIKDSRDMKAKRLNERDRFFYERAMEEMARHFASSRQPLFAYVLTMATHGPYDRTYMPEVDVPGGGPGATREMHEYLRRLAMARTDYDDLVAELTRRFPGERFLIVHYGDHHPVATRSYLGFGDVEAPQDVRLERDSIGYHTYFAVEGIRYAPPRLPETAILDVPYLGTVLLEAARLPLSDAARERKRLMEVCEGRYFGCKDRSQILAFHRRLIDSGLLEAR